MNFLRENRHLLLFLAAMWFTLLFGMCIPLIWIVKVVDTSFYPAVKFFLIFPWFIFYLVLVRDIALELVYYAAKSG